MLNSVLEQLEGMPPRLQGKPAERGECGIGHSGQRIVATDEAHLPGNDDSHGRKSGVCSLSRQVIKKLKVYAGPEHPHAAQKPQAFEITQIAQ